MANDKTGLLLIGVVLIGVLLFSGVLPKSVVLPVTTIHVGGSASPIDSQGNVIVSGFVVNNGFTFGGCSPEPCANYGVTSQLNVGVAGTQYKLNSLTCTFSQGSGSATLISPWNGIDAITEYKVGDSITGGTFMLWLAGNRTTFSSCTLNLSDLTVIEPPTEPPLNCDSGFHLENNVCVVNTITCQSGYHESNGVCVMDSGSGNGNDTSFWEQNLALILGVLAVVGILGFIYLKKR